MWFKLFSGGVQKITTWNSNSVQYKTHETKKKTAVSRLCGDLLWSSKPHEIQITTQ